MGGIADRGALLGPASMSPPLSQHHKTSLVPQAVTLRVCRTGLLRLPLLFPPPFIIPHMAALCPTRHLREHRLRRVHRRAERIPPAARYVIITLLRSQQHREALPRDGPHFITRHRARVCGWHLAPAGHRTPRPARRGVHRCAAIRHRRFWCMVGIIFHPSSLLVAQCEWNGEGGPERRRDGGE